MREKTKKTPLSTRLIILLSLLSITQVGIIGLMAWMTLHDSVSDQIGLRALSLAKTFGSMPDVKRAIQERDLVTLQALSTTTARQNDALFVVVGDADGIRLAHPNPDKLGHSMADDDGDKAELALIHGGAYVEELRGSLGWSIRGKAAVLDEQGDVIGIVSVGFASAGLANIVGRYALWMFTLMLLALFASVGAAIFIAYRLRGELFGLEPEQIAELFQQREATLESVREGIIAINDEGRITTFNRQALNILEISEDVLGRSINEVLPDSRLNEVMFTGEAEFDQEVWFGGRQYVVNRVPYKYGGAVVGAVASFRRREDIDLVSRKLTRIEQYAESLQSQAHEYNNKLHTIAGLIQIDAKDRALELIGSEVAEQQELIRLVKDNIPDHVVAGCLIGKYNRAKELGLKLRVDEASHFDRLPESVSADQLVAILGNLIDNALEATQKHAGTEGAVTVALSDYGEDFVVEVADQGRGVAPEDHKRIFERGFSTKQGEEHGIGLHLIHTIVTQAEGSIHIEDAEGGGARFVVYLPKSKTN